MSRPSTFTTHGSLGTATQGTPRVSGRHARVDPVSSVKVTYGSSVVGGSPDGGHAPMAPGAVLTTTHRSIAAAVAAKPQHGVATNSRQNSVLDLREPLDVREPQWWNHTPPQGVSVPGQVVRSDSGLLPQVDTSWWGHTTGSYPVVPEASGDVEKQWAPADFRGNTWDALVRPHAPAPGWTPQTFATDPNGLAEVPWDAVASAPPRPVADTPGVFRAADNMFGWSSVADAPLPSRRELREQDRAVKSKRRTAKRSGNPARWSTSTGSSSQRSAGSSGNSAPQETRPQNSRRFTGNQWAKTGVLAATVIGVVAANVPQILHNSPFNKDSSTTVAAPQDQSTVGSTSGNGLDPAAMAFAPSDSKDQAVDQILKDRLQKQVAQRQRVTDAAKNAGPLVLQAASAQGKSEAAARAAAKQAALARVQANPKAYAKELLAERGWSSAQFVCLDKLWTKESSWRWNADNPSSSAYGIPQSLPGSKMASAGSDWLTNPATQIRWGLGYISERYSTPCNAWAHSVAHNWY